jgi:SAM-dependent methyltransferase
MSTKTTDQNREPLTPPAPFLIESLPLLPRGRALDVAAGRGRNALYLARHGFSVHALDRDPTALQTLRALADEQHLQNVTTELVELEGGLVSDAVFLPNTYDVVMVFLYLFRPLFPALLQTLTPGGVFIYETFLVENHLRYNHPRHREFCFEPGELRELVRDLHILHYDEGERPRPEGQPGTFTVRLLAQKQAA